MGIKMKYLELFEIHQQKKKLPLEILSSYIQGFPIDKCVVDEDGKISVHDFQVNLNDKDIEELPIQFKEIINGYFNIDNNHLTTLKGCPEKVSGYFSCSGNITLKSLKYVPDAITIYYDNCGCSDDASQLKYIPINAMKNGQVFNYYNNHLEKSFIYNQKDIDDYWDVALKKEPTAFFSLKYNKRNVKENKSNHISWELAEKYFYLKRSKKTDLWEIKRKK